jgi:hypothetical protein
MATGITTRHHRRCPAHDGGKCGKPCVPTYQAWVYIARDGKKRKQTFPTLAAARSWRSAALSDASKGTLRAASSVTLRQAADAWLEGVEAGK